MLKFNNWDDVIPGDLVSWKYGVNIDVDFGVGIVVSVVNKPWTNVYVFDTKKFKLRKFYSKHSLVYHTRGLHVSLLWREEHD